MSELTKKHRKILSCKRRDDAKNHCMTCRTDADWRESITGMREFDCPFGVTKESIESKRAELTISAQAKNATKSIASAAKSIVKTQVLRKGRVSDDLYKKRLNTCTNCPGNHAVFKNGALHTCGQFKDSITGKLPTCGCVLTKKARDESQNCPMGYWANLTIEGK